MEHTVTSEAVKQRIRYVIGVNEPLLESFVGRNVNGLTILTGSQFRLLMA